MIERSHLAQYYITLYRIAELTARGVEFTEPPEERPYGIDSSFRDPSGNQFRLTQVREGLEV